MRWSEECSLERSVCSLASTHIPASLKTWWKCLAADRDREQEHEGLCGLFSKTFCRQGTVDWTDLNTRTSALVPAQTCSHLANLTLQSLAVCNGTKTQPLGTKVRRGNGVYYMGIHFFHCGLQLPVCLFVLFYCPVWNLRAVIWFPFNVSSLVLLPSPLALSISFFC